MKTLMVTIAAAMMALNVAAYNPGNGPGNYCVKSIKGKTVVECNGKPIKKEIMFKNGSCVKPDGSVILANGRKYTLREGECVNSTSIMKLDKHGNWSKKETKTQPAKHEKSKSFKGEKSSKKGSKTSDHGDGDYNNLDNK